MHRNKQSRSKKGAAGRKSTAVPAWASSREAGSEGKMSKRRLFLIIGIVVVVILGILAIPYYQNYIAPFNRTIITADGIEVSARYFLERTRVAGSDPLTMLDALTNELVIEIMAPQYGIQVTEADVDQQLRNLASDGSGDISDIEFEEWYRQQLNDNQLSDDQYRDIIYKNLLAARLYNYLAEQTPTVADQVHLHMIVVVDYDVAQDTAARLAAGEDFASVAQDVSVDTGSGENGGDLGWLPPVIISDYGNLIAALEIGGVTAPLAYYSESTTSSTSSTTPSAYYIFMVSEKESARELDDDNLVILQNMALDLWLDEEIPKHEITYDFDSEMYSWMCWQLEKE